MLLQEIKSARQGLDGSQQLIAASCVRSGLLDLDPNAIFQSTDSTCTDSET